MRPSAHLGFVVCLFSACYCAQSRDNGCSGVRSFGEDSETVLTGTVLRLDHRDDHAEVRIKRVLKGQPDLQPDKTVRVEGVTKTPCHGEAKLRSRDSRIFMLQRIASHNIAFRLNGTLLRITVPNLDRVAAVVKEEPYHRRQLITNLPCELKYCPWGGECIERLGEARCVCPETCPVGYAPVCGSNGNTYVNECRLRRESCNKKTKVYIKYKGPCPTPTG